MPSRLKLAGQMRSDPGDVAFIVSKDTFARQSLHLTNPIIPSKRRGHRDLIALFYSFTTKDTSSFRSLSGLKWSERICRPELARRVKRSIGDALKEQPRRRGSMGRNKAPLSITSGARLLA